MLEFFYRIEPWLFIQQLMTSHMSVAYLKLGRWNDKAVDEGEQHGLVLVGVGALHLVHDQLEAVALGAEIFVKNDCRKQCDQMLELKVAQFYPKLPKKEPKKFLHIKRGL